MSEVDVGMGGLGRKFVYTTTAYLFHERRVDAESVERIPSIFKISHVWRGGLGT